MDTLVLYVRLHEGRYHGQGDWPPSPARLFQALIAGAGIGGPLEDRERSALKWLETLAAPTIAAPRARQARRGVLLYVPNNDSDSIRGDLARMKRIRTATKTFRPYLFDGDVPFVYAWPLSAGTSDDDYLRTVCSLAERLYQLGWGIDMAWAWAEVLDADGLDALLAQYPGCIYRPAAGKGALSLSTPLPGSLESIERRHRALGDRFRYVTNGRTVKVVFRQPPRPRFRWVAYESPPSRLVFELRDPTAEAAFVPRRLTEASALVVQLRDAAVVRLKQALPTSAADVDRVLVGRKPDGTNDGPTAERVRIVPLPSIGHPQADGSIRRVLVEVPAECPLRADDVHWALSGLEPFAPETGELLGFVLTPSTDERMLTHYGLVMGSGWRTWRSVTPAALPVHRSATMERVAQQARTTSAVLRALRHAGRWPVPQSIRVQREPFEGHGQRAEAFAAGTRFGADRLWHVEITFPEPVRGPLVIGDGRFLGLGVMRPVDRIPGVHAFAIESGLGPRAQPIEVARALRRAVMARVQDVLGYEKRLPPFFSGHEPNGQPARAECCPHLAFLVDPGCGSRARLLVLAPQVLERRAPTVQEKKQLQALDTALIGFRELRAGSAGLLPLRPEAIDFEADPLFAPAKVWESVTPYEVTRHIKRVGATEALAADLRRECRRRGLPGPRVVVKDCRGVGGLGLVGSAQLVFEVAVTGPLVLGRSRHFGGGLFAAVSSS